MKHDIANLQPAIEQSFATLADLVRIERQLEELRRKFPGELSPANDDAQQRDAHHAAQEVLRVRRRRDKVFPNELFGEPAWDMLLELFLAECAGKRLSVTGACHASRVAVTTALRWVVKLESGGWVHRLADERDARRYWLVLTPHTSSSMRALLEDTGKRRSESAGRDG